VLKMNMRRMKMKETQKNESNGMMRRPLERKRKRKRKRKKCCVSYDERDMPQGRSCQQVK